MDRETEHAKFLEFIDGLRDYIKRESKGKFNGKMLAENWNELSEHQQDILISAAFVRNADALAELAHQAIHEIHEV